MKKPYISVKQKLIISLVFGAVWGSTSLWLAQPWINDLAELFGVFIAWFIVMGLAIIPGLANAFLLSSLALDRRPKYDPQQLDLPPVTVMIAAYNEQSNIKDTLTSITRQVYSNAVEIIVVDDCSTDGTAIEIVDFINSYSYDPNKFKIRTFRTPTNSRKAGALNFGLPNVTHDYIITVDADTYLFRDALQRIMTTMISGPKNTGAVAGCVLVRNSRENWITKIQEWDYFHGIAVVKRTQSLYQGTLVAQGAFSVYRKDVLTHLGGWPETVGEDIVLTWGIRERGMRVGYAEDAIVFTNVPDSYRQFYHQRKRWARGLIEAFKKYPSVIWDIKPNTPFIWLNLTFPYTDLVFALAFVPGVVAAIFFQWYAIAGVMTLLLLPLVILGNMLMYIKQCRIFDEMGLKVRRNLLGFALYALTYQLIMVPASLGGYLAEFLNLRKTWGTK